jgi:hypothetical protein
LNTQKTGLSMLKWVKVAFALLLLNFYAEAQSFYAVKRDRSLMFTAGTGAAFYLGEMTNPKQLGIAKANIVIGSEYFINPMVSVRVGATWFQLKGDDVNSGGDRWQRNLSFRSNNVEVSTAAAINLIPQGQRFYQRPKINLHAFIGIGVLKFAPKTLYQGQWVYLPPLETEGVKYSTITPVIPYGLGLRIKLDPFFNLLIEGCGRKTFTDHLDDVSILRYPDPATLKSDLSRALSDRRAEIGKQPPNPTQVGKRGNPKNNDSYFTANITLQYYLPTTILGKNGNGKFSQKKLYNQKRRSVYKKGKRR